MSRYALFRRRLAPVAFLLAIGLLARDSCAKEERTHATFVLDFGSAERAVRGVDAELFVRGDSVAVFHRVALEGLHIGPARFVAAMPARDGELRLDVDLGDHHAQLTRRIHADEGATVTVALERDLGPAAPATTPAATP